MIHAIFAADLYGGMGFNGTLPWPHNKEDLQHFKELTHGHIVVMGRNTWDDPKMPKPLPGRINVVVTNRVIKVPGVVTISGDIKSRLERIQAEFPNKKIFIIGGPQLLESCRNLIDQVHLTRMKSVHKSDVKLDLRKFLDGFTVRGVKPGNNCTYETLQNDNIFRI